MSGHGWQPGETHRYLACGRHESALSRMDFWDAFDRAEDCNDCETEVRP